MTDDLFKDLGEGCVMLADRTYDGNAMCATLAARCPGLYQTHVEPQAYLTEALGWRSGKACRDPRSRKCSLCHRASFGSGGQTHGCR